jgi:aspartate carbamoyltransferase regulatory subunit
MLKVDEIEIGTVVDHIKAGKGNKVLNILNIGETYPHRVALMMHMPSKKSKTKDIVKIEGKVVDQKHANIIALLSPGATINIIKGGKVEKKFSVELPDELVGAGKCPNPNCITNSEETENAFRREEGGYRCAFCERLFAAEELV